MGTNNYNNLLNDIDICVRLLEKMKETAKHKEGCYFSEINTLAVRRTRKMVNEILRSYENYR